MQDIDQNSVGNVAESSTPRAFEVVLDHIEALILDGSLGVGDRLPPERDMAAQLGVSRPAIREAIRTLEAQGVLASHVGSGAQAGTHVINDRSQALARLLRLQVALAQFPLDEVMSTRITLERANCGLAVQNADDEGLARLSELVRDMDDKRTTDDYNTLDTRIHIHIAELGRNQLMVDLTGAIRESLRLPILTAERQLEEWEAFRQKLQCEHDAITNAIIARDADLAADLMERHIRTAYEELPLSVAH